VSLKVVGVRHHSPACARLVAHTIRELRPAAVLVEGPADYNDRISHLLLDHRPPLALFSYYQTDDSNFNSWTPFCEYSPEWVALRIGREVGADLKFMDLPAWTRPFQKVENRYADRNRAELDYVVQLQEELGFEGLDALWDHLFEQPGPPADLEKRLEAYFCALRSSEPATEGDLEREQFMSRHLAWAVKRYGSVVVVCGGYHKPVLESTWAEYDGELPVTPTPSKGVRHGSFLVPYSFHRLDSFTGYQSGMPSPFYYQLVWDKGAEAAASILTRKAAERLRALKQPVSSADLVVCKTVTSALQRLRSHPVPTRCDLLDGFCSGLVKEGLESPLPWTTRGTLRPDTHPLLVELTVLFSGDEVGVLDPSTPLPPLVGQVHNALKNHGLIPKSGPLERTVSRDDQLSQLLHRLKVLRLPGFRISHEQEDEVTWLISSHPNIESALVEAGAWGSSLYEAVHNRLKARVTRCEGRLDLVAEILLQARQAGIERLSEPLLQILESQVSGEHNFARLGRAAAVILGLHRLRSNLNLETLVKALFERGLWLMETITGPTLPAEPEEIQGVLALRDTARLLGQQLPSSRHAYSLMERRSEDRDAPPHIRGAALGFLWSLDSGRENLPVQTAASIRASSRPVELGDFLAGLFGLAREEMSEEKELLSAIDELICDFNEKEFLLAVPSLRLAFNYFPPREREKLAQTLLERHGISREKSWDAVNLKMAPSVLMANHELERETLARMERFGLLP